MIITNREVYDAVMSLRSDVQSLTQSRNDAGETLDDHETRIRAIERWKYGVPLATLIAVGSTIAAIYPRH